MEPSITIREIIPTDFPVIERLFGPSGACAGCWCMFWRMGANEWKLKGQNENNRRAFQLIIEQSKVHAAIAFAGEEPVGWVTFGPRESFPRIENSRVLKRDAPRGTWTIPCFYIPRKWRGKGIANQLLNEAVHYCKDHGALEVEGYPIEHADPDHPRRATDIYTGVATQFARAGFHPIPRAEKLRSIYVKRL